MSITGLYNRLSRAGASAIFAAAIMLGSASAQTSSDSLTSGLSLELNIPAYRLDVLRGNNRLTSYSIAPGMRNYATPTGDFSLTQITWNPWWYPPKSYWARKEKITPPGPANPMGKVKLLLRGSLFLHATPFTSSIGRAASHGCIRMRIEDAVALARLVQHETQAAISDASVDSLVATWNETREVDIPARLPVRIVYRLAEVRGDSLLLHPDVYRLGRADEEATLRALGEAALDTSRIDRPALRPLLRRARSQHVRVHVSQLVSKAR